MTKSIQAKTYADAKDYIKEVGRALGMTSMQSTIRLVFQRVHEDMVQQERQRISITDIKVAPPVRRNKEGQD